MNYRNQIVKAEQRANKTHHKMFKISSGWYLYHDGNHLFEILKLDYEERHSMNGWWGGIEFYNGVVSLDPMPTLKSLKASLR